MTIPTSYSTVTYQGNGTTTAWSVPFDVKEVTDLYVYVTNRAVSPNTVTLISAADYTFTEGVVTYPKTSSISPLPSTKRITLQRRVGLTQNVNFIEQNGYFLEDWEAVADRLISIDQQQQEQLDRCVKVPIGTADSAESYLTDIQTAVTTAEAAADRAEAAVIDMPAVPFKEVFAIGGTTPFALDNSHNGYLARAAVGASGLVVNLPQMSSLSFPYLVAVKRHSGTQTLTVNPHAGDTIDGASSVTISDNGTTLIFVADDDTLAGSWTVVYAGVSVVADNTISTAKIIDAAVTTAKIADSGVTAVKILDGAVTAAKANDNTFPLAKLAQAGAATVVCNSTTSTANIGTLSMGTNTILGRVSGGLRAISIDNGHTLIDDGTLFSLTSQHGEVGGRLTASSSLPAPDVGASDWRGYSNTSVTTLYYLPYTSAHISLYDDTHSLWRLVTFSSVNVSLGSITSATVYDVFAEWNGTTSGFTMVTVAWSSQSSRGAGSPLAFQDGILVSSGTPKRRYLGTIYTTATGTTQDTYNKRYIWNMYNRVNRSWSVIDSGVTSYTYAVATTWRAKQGASTFRLETVVGYDDSAVSAFHQQPVAAGASMVAAIGIGRSTSTPDVTAGTRTTTGSCLSCGFNGRLGLGLRYLYGLEYNSGTTASTFYCSSSGIFTDPEASYMTGILRQ